MPKQRDSNPGDNDGHPEEERFATASVAKGRPPQPTARPGRVKRREKSAHASVKKDTMLVQTERDPRARWSGSKPAWKKR